MTRPLYADAAQLPEKRDGRGNAGLWFDKFCNTWSGEWSMSSAGGDGESPKLKWIRSVADPHSWVGQGSQVAESARRLMRLVTQKGGRWAVFTTESRFVTGLGRSHPVENGFAWHPTLGTPFLPGSSIKGLVRAWAELEADPSPDPGIRECLLGDEGHSGRVAFLDAVPIGSVKLEADVMTPHYAGWSPDEPPGDWRSPTPIPFLVTAAGAPFLFAIVPCHRSVSDGDLFAAWDWLSSALEWTGSGAKTSIGYGRFVIDDLKTTELEQRLAEDDRLRHERQRRKEAMSTPAGRWSLMLEGKSEEGVLDLVRINLEAGQLEDPVERRALAEAVISMHGDWVEGWRKRRKQDPGTSHGGRRVQQLARLLDSVLAETGQTD